MPAKIGVVTVTYNSQRFINPFLDCCRRQAGIDFVLIVVDSASQDDTLVQVDAFDVGLMVMEVIRVTENVGVAAGNNIGIERCRVLGVDHILLLNNDTEFGDMLFADLLTDLESSDADAVSPKIYYSDTPDRIWYAGGTFKYWRGIRPVHQYFQGTDATPGVGTARLVDYASTCCLLFSVALIDKVGLMDERYFVYWDDADFVYRMKCQGYTIRYFPGAHLFHKVGGLTGGEASPFARRLYIRNQVFFLRKFFGLIPRLYHFLGIQVTFLACLLLGRIDVAGFRQRQTAFIEGLRMDLEGVDPLYRSRSVAEHTSHTAASTSH